VKRLLVAALLCASTALGQSPGAAYKLDQVAVRLDGGAGGSGFSTPSGCVATSVPIFLGSPVALGCDAGLTYDPETDTLTTGDGTTVQHSQGAPLRSYRLGVSRALGRTGNLVVAWIGDSWSAGWTHSLRKRLEGQYGHGGDGYYPLADVSSGGHWTVYGAANSADGLGSLVMAGTWDYTNLAVAVGDSFNLFESHTADLAATATVTSKATNFAIHYKRQAGGGTFTWSIDGGAATAVDTSAGTAGTFGVATTTTASLAAHTLVISITDAGTAGVTFGGVDMQVPAAGVRVHETGVGGTRTAHWVAPTSAGWVSDLTALAPDLVVISLGGVNDKGQDVPTATYAANLATLRARVRAALPDADIVFLSQAETGVTGTLHTVAEYLTQERAVAFASGDGWVSNYALFKDYATSNAMGLWADPIHPSTAGYLALYATLGAYLQDGTASHGAFTIFPRYAHGYDFDSIQIGGTATEHYMIGDVTNAGLMLSLYGNRTLQLAGTPNVTLNSDGTTALRGVTIGGIGITGAGTTLALAGNLRVNVNGVVLASGLGYDSAAFTSPSATVIQIGGSNTSELRMRAAEVTALKFGPTGPQWLTGARPTCDAAARGSVWYVAGGTGVADTFEVCVKSAADTYSWVTLF